jgi:hypothetical protein
MQYSKGMKKYYPIPEWENYGVSKTGEVARIKGGVRGATVGLVLSQHQHKTRGYLTVRLYDKGRQKTFDVHRLVAMTFLGSIPDGMQVCHNNGIKTDCRLSNLRIDTVVSNAKDKILHDKTNRGEKNGNSKYSVDQIKDLKLKILNGETDKAIAKYFEMPLSHVRNIRNGYKWKWLEATCKK